MLYRNPLIGPQYPKAIRNDGYMLYDDAGVLVIITIRNPGRGVKLNQITDFH
tara:strand:- start:57 stop:212 length:156 start_codon:yes stop_codon:yes gene_type:complete